MPKPAQHPSRLFTLVEEIGSGGYVIVYKATRATAVSEFDYAVKVLNPNPFVTDYEKALLRFQREVKAMQLLQHRAIVPYYEAGPRAGWRPVRGGAHLIQPSRGLF
jgi:serine/threonine protein kinase